MSNDFHIETEEAPPLPGATLQPAPPQKERAKPKPKALLEKLSAPAKWVQNGLDAIDAELSLDDNVHMVAAKLELDLMRERFSALMQHLVQLPPGYVRKRADRYELKPGQMVRIKTAELEKRYKVGTNAQLKVIEYDRMTEVQTTLGLRVLVERAHLVPLTEG